jgi:alpha-ketoglutarate-dependent taurine dioxygenase
VTRHAEEMAAFDLLPPKVKDAVRNAPVYLGTERILTYYRENGTAATLRIIETVVANWQAKNPMVEG